MNKEDFGNFKQIYSKQSRVYYSLYHANSFGDSTLVILGDSIQFSNEFNVPIKEYSTGWYRVSVSVFYPDKEWNTWLMTQFIVSLSSHDKDVKTNIIRMQRVTEQGKWQEVFIDIKCTQELHADTLKLHFWNAQSPKKIYIDNVRVELYINQL